MKRFSIFENINSAGSIIGEIQAQDFTTKILHPIYHPRFPFMEIGMKDAIDVIARHKSSNESIICLERRNSLICKLLLLLFIIFVLFPPSPVKLLLLLNVSISCNIWLNLFLLFWRENFDSQIFLFWRWIILFTWML